MLSWVSDETGSKDPLLYLLQRQHLHSYSRQVSLPPLESLLSFLDETSWFSGFRTMDLALAFLGLLGQFPCVHYVPASRISRWGLHLPMSTGVSSYFGQGSADAEE